MGFFSAKNDPNPGAQVPQSGQNGVHTGDCNYGNDCVESYSRNTPYDADNYNPKTGQYKNSPPRAKGN